VSRSERSTARLRVLRPAELVRGDADGVALAEPLRPHQYLDGFGVGVQLTLLLGAIPFGL